MRAVLFSPLLLLSGPCACDAFVSSRAITTPSRATPFVARNRQSCVAMSSSEGTPRPEPTVPTGQEVASLVERSFVVACSNAETEYATGLRSFVQSAMTAYECGYSVPALSLELSLCPNQSAGRPLQPDEVELRSVWMTLVYLTLEKARWPQRRRRTVYISAPFMDRFSDFVDNITRAHARGYDLKRLKLEEMLKHGTEPRTPLEAAVLSQSMRIVFMTLGIMSEGWSN